MVDHREEKDITRVDDVWQEKSCLLFFKLIICRLFVLTIVQDSTFAKNPQSSQGKDGDTNGVEKVIAHTQAVTPI